jgi:hypothetical protein
VWLIPHDPAMRRPGFYRFAGCDSNGRYETRALRPGEYYALAVAGANLRPWMSGGFDGRILSQAGKVTVRAGETSTVDLRVVAQTAF